MIAVPLDAFTAVFHRRSGTTHLLGEPAPEMLAVLAQGAMTAEDLLATLAQRFDLLDADARALAARLDELAAAGLVEAIDPIA